MRSIGLIVYVVIGVAVAAARDYLSDVGSIGDIVNLLLAVLLWPLVLLGVDFNLDIGGGRDGEGENKNGALLLLAPRWPMRDPRLDRRGSLRWDAGCLAQPVGCRGIGVLEEEMWALARNWTTRECRAHQNWLSPTRRPQPPRFSVPPPSRTRAPAARLLSRELPLSATVTRTRHREPSAIIEA